MCLAGSKPLGDHFAHQRHGPALARCTEAGEPAEVVRALRAGKRLALDGVRPEPQAQPDRLLAAIDCVAGHAQDQTHASERARLASSQTVAQEYCIGAAGGGGPQDLARLRHADAPAGKWKVVHSDHQGPAVRAQQAAQGNAHRRLRSGGDYNSESGPTDCVIHGEANLVDGIGGAHQMADIQQATGQ